MFLSYYFYLNSFWRQKLGIKKTEWHFFDSCSMFMIAIFKNEPPKRHFLHMIIILARELKINFSPSSDFSRYLSFKSCSHSIDISELPEVYILSNE